MRRKYLVGAALALLVFVLISAVLARVYSADGAESSAITALIKAEARGDGGTMIDRIHGCAANSSCRARVAANVAALTRPGAVSILDDEPSTGFSLVGTVGAARVAWKSPGSRPIVQCIRVRRAGDALSGLKVELLAISQRIKSDAGCPARF